MRDRGLITCPRCDFEQSAADECARCGVIFAKLRKAAESWRSQAAAGRGLYGDSLPRTALSSQEARLEIQLFLGLTILFSAPFYGICFLTAMDLPGNLDGVFLLIGLFQWTPGAAAIVTRLMSHHNLRGIGWGWGKTHVYLAGAIALPFLLAVLLVYFPVWAMEVDAFDQEAFDAAESWLGREGFGGAVLFLLPVLAATLGEEVGWRGLLTPQLYKLTGLTKASLITGLIWSVWHYPFAAVQLVYYRPDIPVWYGLLCFTATVTGLTFFFSWVRIRSQSIWPAVLLHVSCNGAHFGLDAITNRTTTLASYVTCQYGAGFAVVGWLFLAIFWRGLHASLRASRGPQRSWALSLA